MAQEQKHLDKRTLTRLLKSGNWMIRMDNDGESFNGFRWNPIGKWTETPVWNEKPTCNSGGLFGQNHKAAGYCTPGSRLVLCETDGQQIVVDDNKVKVRRARILAVGAQIPVIFIENYPISLNLSKFTGSLPLLASIGGNANLRGYTGELPLLASIGGNADLRGRTGELPLLASIGGNADLAGYTGELPLLASIGGNADLAGYTRELPVGIKIAGMIFRD